MPVPRPRNLIIIIALVFSFGRIPALAAERLQGRVIDEDGAAVAGAMITLSISELPLPIIVSSDEAGRFVVNSIRAGAYRLRVEKTGFYAYVSSDFKIGTVPRPVEIVLNHRQEFEEKIEVVYSAPAIDRQEPALEINQPNGFG